jgi:hypothetical protein
LYLSLDFHYLKVDREKTFSSKLMSSVNLLNTRQPMKSM